MWRALGDEIALFPNAEHDDLFDALQTMVEGAMDPGPRAGVLWLDIGPPLYPTWDSLGWRRW